MIPDGFRLAAEDEIITERHYLEAWNPNVWVQASWYYQGWKVARYSNMRKEHGNDHRVIFKLPLLKRKLEL